MDEMFISKPHRGLYFLAQRSRGGHKFLWSIMPVAPVAADVRIAPCDVPYAIRRQAYRYLDRQRKA
jgi:hypothetical protein